MTNRQYFNLSIPAPQRLAMMRADLATHAARYPYCPEYVKPKTWRDVRSYRLDTWAAAFGTLCVGRDNDTRVWYSHNGEYFRDERDASDILRLDHTGWFTDDGGDTAIGIVGRLPHGRFIAGYRLTHNDERVYFPDVFNDEGDAAMMADEHARVFAESALEDDERFRAMFDAESLVESKESDLCEAWSDYRAAWCAYLTDHRHASAAIKARDWVRELISDLRAFRVELTDAKTAYERGGK